MEAKFWLFDWHLQKSIYLFYRFISQHSTSINLYFTKAVFVCFFFFGWKSSVCLIYITEQCLFNCFIIHCCAAHFVRVLRTWKTMCKHIFSLYKMSHWRWIWILWALHNWKKHPWSRPSTSTLIHFHITKLPYLILVLSKTQRTQGRPLQHLPLSLSAL